MIISNVRITYSFANHILILEDNEKYNGVISTSNAIFCVISNSPKYVKSLSSLVNIFLFPGRCQKIRQGKNKKRVSISIEIYLYGDISKEFITIHMF